MTDERLIAWRCPECGTMWVTVATCPRPWTGRGREPNVYHWHEVGDSRAGGRHNPAHWRQPLLNGVCYGRAIAASGRLAEAAITAYHVGGDGALCGLGQEDA